MPTLWVAFERVQARAPIVRPWKPPLNDMATMLLDTLQALSVALACSSLENISTNDASSLDFSSQLLWMHATFSAFSTAELLHTNVITLCRPSGRTPSASKPRSSSWCHSAGGKSPRAGRETDQARKRSSRNRLSKQACL